MKTEQVIKDFQKVIDALPEPRNNPNDIAIITSINGKVTSIKYKDLDKYVVINGELKFK